MFSKIFYQDFHCIYFVLCHWTSEQLLFYIWHVWFVCCTLKMKTWVYLGHQSKKRYLPCFHSSCRIKTDKWSLILCHKCQFNQKERVRWEVRNKKMKPYLDVIIILLNGLTFWFEMNKQEILLIMKHGYPVFFGCSLRWEKTYTRTNITLSATPIEVAEWC